MKVLLIFPPLWAVHRPYLSLPSLAGYLKAQRIEVVQKDFNLEAYDFLVSGSNLRAIEPRLRQKFKTLESSRQLLPGAEQQYYCSLFKALANIDFIARQVDAAKATLRHRNKYFDLENLLNAKNILFQAQNIIAADCFPSGMDLMSASNVSLKRSFDDISALVQNNHENPFIGVYEQILHPCVTGNKPDVIGISITGERQLIPGLTLSRMIKQHYPEIHVVAGGYTVTMLADVLGRFPVLFSEYFDSLIVNEGEKPLHELAEKLSHRKPLSGVPNLVYKDKEGIWFNQVMPAESINSLPEPCFDGLRLDRYLSPETVLPVLSSRGCYWGKCAFCSHNESYRRSYQVRNPVKVADDIEAMSARYGVRHFAFTDEAISPSSMKGITAEIINRRLDVRFSTNIRLEKQFTPELCNQMYAAGFRVLHLGLESGCNRVLEHMQKGITREAAREVLKNSSQAKMWNHVYVFFGFPGETRAEAEETSEFLLENKEHIHSFGITSFMLNRGSLAMNHPGNFGISSIELDPDKVFNLDYDYSVTNGLSAGEARMFGDVYREQISRQFRYPERLKLHYEDIFLYVSHYEESDPVLKKLSTGVEPNPQPQLPITRKSMPELKTGVTYHQLEYDIGDIIANKITRNAAGAAYPEPKCFIFNPVSGKLIGISLLDMEIAGYCNGKYDVNQIASKLSRKYNTPGLIAEKASFVSLKHLLDEGYLVLRNPE